METSSRFCPSCGAANPAEETTCFACHKPLDQPADEQQRRQATIWAVPPPPYIPSPSWPQEQQQYYAQPAFGQTHVSQRMRHSRRQFIIGGLVGGATTLALGGWLATKYILPEGKYISSEESTSESIWSPNMRYVALLDVKDGSIAIQDSHLRPVRIIQFHTPVPVSEDSIFSPPSSLHADINWSPDSTHILVSWDGHDGYSFALWRIKDGKRVATFDASSSNAVWSPDGTLIASSSSDPQYEWQWQISVRQAGDGKEILHAALPTEQARYDGPLLTWSPDNKYIAFTSADGYQSTDTEVTITIWDVATKSVTNVIRVPNYPNLTGQGRDISRIVWSPTKNEIALSTADALWLVNPFDKNDTYMLKEDPHHNFYHGDWSPDGTLLPVAIGNPYPGNASLEVWDAAKRIRVPLASGSISKKLFIGSLGWSDDNRSIIVADYNNVLTTWKVR